MPAGEAAIGERKRTDRPTATDRLLAEAMRFYEFANGPAAAANELHARQAARETVGSIEIKIVARAKALPVAPLLARDIASLRRSLRGLSVLGFLFAGAAGAATAIEAMTGIDGTVNFFWLLASLLGLPVVSLVVCLALMAMAPRQSRGGVIGSAVLTLWRWASSRYGANPHRLAALHALAARWGQGPSSRWFVSSLSHGIWFGYVLGGLVMALIALSARFYTFVWETTILSADTYVQLTEALAALPAALGVAVPDQAVVRAAQWPGSDQSGDEILWSSLLISAIVLYGLLPRALGLVISAVMAVRGVATSTLDLRLPYYAQLVAELAPLAAATRIVDDDAVPARPRTSAAGLGQSAPAPPPGPVYLLGWEVDAPASGWPPAGTPAQAHDLGRREARAELEQAIAALGASAEPVARVVAVADLRQSPDRGVTAVFAALEAAAPGRLVVVFTGDAALDQRLAGDDVSKRVADWAAAGERAGVDRVRMVAIDLDSQSDETAHRFAQFLGA